MTDHKEYYAFISYKREDEKWAKWLAGKLENYHLPSTLNGKELPKNLRPVFRDTDELSAGNLPRQIYQALAISKNLIVICSPRSAQSEWVNKEIKDFIELKDGKAENIYPFIIDGSPFSKDKEQECFPTALLSLPDNEERLGGNINEQGGREAAFVKIISGMLDVSFDSLWQKHERAQKRKRIAIVIASLLFALVCLGIGGYIVSQNIKLDEANKEIAAERDRANLERDRAENANSSLILANDSIRMQKEKVSQINDDLTNTNKQLTIERDNVLRANWSIMENRARFVAEKGEQLIKDGDSYIARLLALEILPKDLKNPDKPYTPEAESMLRKALMVDNAIFKCDKSRVKKVSFSPDGSRIVSASYDETFRIWNAETGGKIDKPILSFNFSYSPDGEKIAYETLENDDLCLNIWDIERNKQITKIHTGHDGSILSLSFSPNGKKIVSASNDGTCKIWNVETGMQIGETIDEFTNCVCFSPDGNNIISVYGSICIYDSETGLQIGTPIEGGGYYAAFSPDGKRFVTAVLDTIKIWDVETMKPIGKPSLGHKDYIQFVTFSPDGKTILSASADNTIRIWDAETGLQIGQPLIGHLDIVNFASFSSDGKKIVSASDDRTVRIWDVEQRQTHPKSLPQYYGKFRDGCISPDGKKIVTASGSSYYGLKDAVDATVKIWDAETGLQIGKSLVGHTGIVNSVSFSPDGKKIVSASVDGTIRIWDAGTGLQMCEPLRQIYEPRYQHQRRVESASFSPDGKKIVSASSDDTIRIWDTETGLQIAGVPFNASSSPNSVSFSPDGKKIVSASDDGTIRIWDSQTGQQIGEPLRGHSSRVNSVSFSPNGKRFVSASDDRTICVWSTETSLPIGEPFIGHTGSVSYASFSPDGKRIVSASYDNTIRIWDAETGLQIAQPLGGDGGGVVFASFFPDGNNIISISLEDTIIRIWPYPSLQELIDQTRERFKDRELTPEERRMYYLE